MLIGKYTNHTWILKASSPHVIGVLQHIGNQLLKLRSTFRFHS